MERQQKKDQKREDEETKNALIEHYFNQFGVMPSKQ
jgi:hypothetical protein